MNWLHAVVQMPLSEALGWTVLHSLWQGIVAAAILGVVLASTRSPRVRYASACCALIAMAVCFGLTLLRLLPPEHSVAHGPLVAATPPFSPASQVPSATYALKALVPWLAPLWLAGVCLFYLRYMLAWISGNRLRHRGACNAPGRWQATLAQLAKEARIRRAVVLMESLFVDTPVVLGHFRPVILVPLGFVTGLPADQVEAVLFHELAHIARCDYLANIFQRVLEGMLFYHPAVWWIGHVIRQEREHCCDDVVVAWRGDARAYAAALTELELRRQDNWPGHEAALAGKGGNLLKRITRLLYPKSPSGIWAPIVATAALFITAGLVTAGYHAAAQTATRSKQADWNKWLNEDAAYIITDKEKAAFEHLTTDPERQHFIEQFWERRNPTPGSSENAFKTEHSVVSPSQTSISPQRFRGTRRTEAISTSSMGRRTKLIRTSEAVTHRPLKPGHTEPVPIIPAACSPSSIGRAQMTTGWRRRITPDSD